MQTKVPSHLPMHNLCISIAYLVVTFIVLISHCFISEGSARPLEVASMKPQSYKNRIMKRTPLTFNQSYMCFEGCGMDLLATISAYLPHDAKLLKNSTLKTLGQQDEAYIYQSEIPTFVMNLNEGSNLEFIPVINLSFSLSISNTSAMPSSAKRFFAKNSTNHSEAGMTLRILNTSPNVQPESIQLEVMAYLVPSPSLIALADGMPMVDPTIGICTLIWSYSTAHSVPLGALAACEVHMAIPKSWIQLVQEKAIAIAQIVVDKDSHGGANRKPKGLNRMKRMSKKLQMVNVAVSNKAIEAVRATQAILNASPDYKAPPGFDDDASIGDDLKPEGLHAIVVSSEAYVRDNILPGYSSPPEWTDEEKAIAIAQIVVDKDSHGGANRKPKGLNRMKRMSKKLQMVNVAVSTKAIEAVRATQAILNASPDYKAPPGFDDDASIGDDLKPEGLHAIVVSSEAYVRDNILPGYSSPPEWTDEEKAIAIAQIVVDKDSHGGANRKPKGLD
eukprot:UC4_evm3s1532